MKYILDTSKITPQECRDRAAGLLAHAEEYEVTGEREAVTVAKAQVWATLATVPEPLEEVHGQLIESPAHGPVIPIPVLICPHGMQAKIITIIDNPDAARYTWKPDCTQGCP